MVPAIVTNAVNTKTASETNMIRIMRVAGALSIVMCLGAVLGVRAGTPPVAAHAAAEVAVRTETSWHDTFAVSRTDLASVGRNGFFILEPGYQLILQGREEGKTVVLTVSVLAETKVVDGVVTRVVEERETQNGIPVEISRNYFAIDRRTRDIYYFGEDTGGAWNSGENGARFGLAMPGSPRVGQRFYQEVAPGIAMDRTEIVSLSETVRTPRGVFRHCLKTRETTPLHPDEVEYKWYAPGIGLIWDENTKLARYGNPPR